MELKKELDKLTNTRLYIEKLEEKRNKDAAEIYYVQVFKQKILNAAIASDLSNEATFTADANDIKYFSYLRQIAGREKIFVYATNDELSIVVKWS